MARPARQRSIRKPGTGRKNSRRRPARIRRKAAPKPALAVELAISVDDGWDKDARRVRLVGMAGPRRGSNESVTIRRRQTAARRVSAGCRPPDLARLLAAIGHGQRLAMLRELLAGEATHKALAKVTELKAGPLYYHIRELRVAGLIGPKVRDLYMLTRKGRRVILSVLALERLTRGGAL